VNLIPAMALSLNPGGESPAGQSSVRRACIDFGLSRRYFSGTR
jgi:hypothetical protein